MKNFHNKSDDEINERSAGTSGGQPLKMRKVTNVSLNDGDMKRSTEYVTEGFKDDKNNFNRLYQFDPTESDMTREEVFRKNVFDNINEPFTSAIYAKLNENGTVFAADCFLDQDEACAVVRSIAAMVGSYYKGYARGDYDKMLEGNYRLVQEFHNSLDHFWTDEEKAGLVEAMKRYMKKWQTKE